MKYRIFFFILSILPQFAKSQDGKSCDSVINLCGEQFNGHTFTSPCDMPPDGYWVTFSIDHPEEILLNALFGGTGGYGYKLYGPFLDAVNNHCVDLTAHFHDSSNVTSLTYALGIDSLALPPGTYILQVFPSQCDGTIELVGGADLLDCITDVPCENCIGSFAPEAGKKYLITAWAKEDSASLNKLTYTHPNITVYFIGAGDSTGAIFPSGYIIDGWQRIEKEFTIPTGTLELDIVLDCTTGDCLFDDIRVLPFDGSMKTYVYDPVTLRLAAELDERHYATFYEYDEEGKLMRIKKETERGVMTIQESKTSIPKQ